MGGKLSGILDPGLPALVWENPGNFGGRAWGQQGLRRKGTERDLSSV